MSDKCPSINQSGPIAHARLTLWQGLVQAAAVHSCGRFLISVNDSLANSPFMAPVCTCACIVVPHGQRQQGGSTGCDVDSRMPCTTRFYMSIYELVMTQGCRRRQHVSLHCPAAPSLPLKHQKTVRLTDGAEPAAPQAAFKKDTAGNSSSCDQHQQPTCGM